MSIAAPALAQTATTGGFTERPDDALSRNLRSLAQDPKNVSALMGAGKAALELGDAQAALTFFARAEEQLPSDGRVKMWIASALVQLQQPHAALKFFHDATSMGVAEAEVARDRGLAYDIAGNPRQAQRDYRLALQRGRDDEVTRRLALSLAISGEREPALRLLEDQLLTRDPAAERTRALVLALTGDTAGANRAVQADMPGPRATAMAPFLARLPLLSPAERALAVHLGVFPGNGGSSVPSTAYAANTEPVPQAVTDAGRPDPAQTLLARRVVTPEPVSTEPRRRPDVEPAAVATRKPAERTPVRSGRSALPSNWSLARGELAPPVHRQTTPKPKPVEIAAVEPPHPSEPAAPDPVPAQTMSAAEDQPPVATEVPPAEVPAAEMEAVVPSPQPESAPAGSSRLADLSAAIADIPEPAPAKPKPAARAASTATSGKPAAQHPAAAATPKKAKPAPPAEPSRIWVQIAGGAAKDALPREYARLKAKAPKLLGSRSAWTAPLNATNRLLVGPFATAKEAQAFINQLKAAGLTGFAWTSAAGQKIEKLPAK
ncbi:MAG: SPOR domain-containing protein [Allosphingosinicella sp.]